jgi:biopolymer transport protein TolQ
MGEILQAVSRASKRSSAVVHEEMRVGVYGLATIASLAPWVGIFGTLWTFPNAFGPPINGTGGRELALARMFDHFAISMWFTAFGLAVGLMSLWFYRYLTGRLRTFDLEMENASFDLLNQLSRFPGRFAIAPAVGGPIG